MGKRGRLLMERAFDRENYGQDRRWTFIARYCGSLWKAGLSGNVRHRRVSRCGSERAPLPAPAAGASERRPFRVETPRARRLGNDVLRPPHGVGTRGSRTREGRCAQRPRGSTRSPPPFDSRLERERPSTDGEPRRKSRARFERRDLQLHRTSRGIERRNDLQDRDRHRGRDRSVPAVGKRDASPIRWHVCFRSLGRAAEQTLLCPRSLWHQTLLLCRRRWELRFRI